MGIEPMSRTSIYSSLIHRLSPSNPQGGNPSLSRRVGCNG